MPAGGPTEIGEHVGSDGASSRPPTRPIQEWDLEGQAKSENGQDVQGSARGPPTSREASQINPPTLMANMAVLVEGQATLQGVWLP